MRGSWSHRALWPRVALLAFLCKAVVPVGYMPVPLDEGGPFVPCHGTIAGVLLLSFGAELRSAAETAHGTHAHTGSPSIDDGAAAHEAWEHCPLGIAAASAPVPSEYALDLPVSKDGFEPVRDALAPIARNLCLYRARGPPA